MVYIKRLSLEIESEFSERDNAKNSLLSLILLPDTRCFWEDWKLIVFPDYP